MTGERRFWLYRSFHGQQLRSVKVVETGHGSLHRLHPRHDRTHRPQAPEYSSVDARTGLVTALSAGPAAVRHGASPDPGLPLAAARIVSAA